MLDTLDQLVERQEAVVFLWQPSHVGAPVNEAADVAAGAALKVERWVQVPSYTPRFCSLLYSMATRTPFRWATRMMCRVVHRRLLDAVDETVVQLPSDIVCAPLRGEGEAVLAQSRGQRLLVGDKKRYASTAARTVAAAMGCRTGALTPMAGRCRSRPRTLLSSASTRRSW